MLNWFDIVILSLAVWRVSNLLADSDQAGPLNVLHELRFKLGVKYDENSIPYAESGSIGELVICIYCSSIWLGIIAMLCYYWNSKVTIFVSLPLALSALAIIINERIR